MDVQPSILQPIEIDFQPLAPLDLLGSNSEPQESQQVMHESPHASLESEQSCPVLQQLNSDFQPEPENQNTSEQPQSPQIDVYSAVVKAVSSLGLSCNNINPAAFSKCSTSLEVTVPPDSSHPTVRS